MALGGITVSYDGTVPADGENAGLGAQRIRSLETTIQQVLDSEHNFAASGGANTGYHRLGSARAFYGVESTVSSSGTDGRLMVTSDTSRLFHVGSVGTMFLGGQASALLNTAVNGYTLGQQSYWATEIGNAGPDSNGSVTLTYSAFSAAPFVVACCKGNLPTQRPFVFLRSTPGVSSVVAGVWDQNANSAVTVGTVYYTAVGLRAL